MAKPILRDLKVKFVPISRPKPYGWNARTHSSTDIAELAMSVTTFGWTNPIVVDGNDIVIAGHARLAAAKLLRLKRIPVIQIEDMSEAQVRAYRLADNKLAAKAGWDNGLLKVELTELIELAPEFEIASATGFSMGEIDLIMGAAAKTENVADVADESDSIGSPVSKRGDFWKVGPHGLLCGDALDRSDHERLMDGQKAELVVSDPPYNVNIAGNVSGLGRRKHREFIMGSGEMNAVQYIEFLSGAFKQMAESSVSGTLIYLFADWRHLGETLAAGKNVFSELKNICVWDKSSGGMGSLYRSQHELVFVFKNGKARHINNVALGSYGRNRTNVWRYGGLNSFGAGRDEALDAHPTVKPVAMIADAILDASNRRGIVLDPFAGSGTILIAAERTGRHARAIELDPLYVDVALRRYRRVVGTEPIHVATGATFSEIEAAVEAASIGKGPRR
jgi:DNA modification methylase